MAPPNLNIRVSTVNSVITFKVDSKIKPGALFDQIARTLGLRETWFFGLRYKVGNIGTYKWVDMNQKLTKQGIKIEAPDKMDLELRFKYYPEDIVKDLIQYETIKLFYLQLKQDILDLRTYCPAENSVVLASYALQVQDGDYDPEVHVPGTLGAARLLPIEVIQKHDLPDEEWEEKIIDFYKAHQTLDREEAMIEYCKVVESLDTYGINYFPITNSKGTKMFLGVDALGINTYDIDDKLNPKFSFPWSGIQKLKKSSGSLTVKLDKINFVAKSNDAAHIYDLCTGTNNMYIRSRKPETLEVQQMRNQRAEDKKIRAVEREQLYKEIQRRKMIEENSKGALEDINRLSNENKEMESQLMEAQSRIEESEQLLAKIENDKTLLEAELETLRILCEKHKDCEGNNGELLSQINFQEEEVSRLRDEIEMKENEAKDLEREIISIRSKEDDYDQPILNGDARGSSSSSSSSSSSCSSDVEEEEVPREIEKIAEEEEMVTSSVQIKIDDYELSQQSEALNTVLPSTDQSTEEKMIDINKSTLMRQLKNRLDDTRNVEFETTEDKIHRDNLQKGRQKFITLKEIRCGTIKRKIEQFEAL